MILVTPPSLLTLIQSSIECREIKPDSDFIFILRRLEIKAEKKRDEVQVDDWKKRRRVRLLVKALSAKPPSLVHVNRRRQSWKIGKVGREEGKMSKSIGGALEGSPPQVCCRSSGWR